MKQPFRKLAEKYGDRIYTFAYYSLRSREEAEDVTQEVLVRLWQHVEEIDPGKLAAWVMSVTRNAVIDAARRRQTKSAVIAEGVSVDAVEAVAISSNPGADHALHAAELRNALERALAAIDEPHRSIIVMREIQGMSYADIAHTLDMPLASVKVYLHRSRKKLREMLRGKV
ncbi:MAG: sigma-70 family RNA polymerase sigma factor [Chitinivibrionia bacterium]|nr:sigma-70 family RNA polymerase sigma factor [Chitinivibrionia bacterium]